MNLPHDKRRRRAIHLFFPRLQLAFEFGGDLLLPVIQVVPLADVVFQVVERLDAAVAHKFPISVANGLLLPQAAVYSPTERSLLLWLLAKQNRQQVDAV